MGGFEQQGAAGAFAIVVVGAIVAVVAGAVGAFWGRAGRAALWVALAVSLAVIGWVTIGLTLVGGYGNGGGVNLSIGQEIERALRTGNVHVWLNVVGNVLMFMPLGATVTWLTRGHVVLRVLTATFLGGALSVAIECTQYVLGRVADVDDIILNTFGALLGSLFALALGCLAGAKLTAPPPGS